MGGVLLGYFTIHDEIITMQYHLLGKANVYCTQTTHNQ